MGGRVEGGWNFWSDGRAGQRVKISRTGLYTVVIRAWGSPEGGTWPEMALFVDGLEVKLVPVDRNRPADYRFALDLEEGSHEVAAGFLKGRKGIRNEWHCLSVNTLPYIGLRFFDSLVYILCV